MSGGGSGGGNTTNTVQSIPEFEQEASQRNQALAQSLGSQPFPTYGGSLIAGVNGQQAAGQNLADLTASNYQPQLNQAIQNGSRGSDSSVFSQNMGQANQGVGNALANTGGFNAYQGAAGSQIGHALQGQGAQGNAAQNAQALTNPNAVGAYMNPYIQQALAPQVQDLQLQLAGQQQGINSQATQSGAFGDARQGAQAALQNLYGNQAMNQLIGTGYNNAFTQALQSLGQAQNTQLGAASQYGNMAQTGLAGAQQLAGLAGQQQQEQGIQLQGAQQYGTLAGLGTQQQNQQTQAAAQQAAMANQQQQQMLTGANAVYNVGQQQQTQQQNELNAAYQQYLNQVNWPYQMLNVQESALSNSPYNIQTAVTLPSANSTAQGFGTLASAAGLLGGLGSNKASVGGNVFGGA
jgi:hypothetical protein